MGGPGVSAARDVSAILGGRVSSRRIIIMIAPVPELRPTPADRRAPGRWQEAAAASPAGPEPEGKSRRSSSATGEFAQDHH